MASKKTPVDKLSSAITEILSSYDSNIQADLDTITKKMGAKGATALRQASKDSFKQHTGNYAKGWKYEHRKTQRYSKTTVFNEKYGLPHLLENDHVVKDGTGRVVGQYTGRKHIDPIAKELTDRYVEEVIKKL